MTITKQGQWFLTMSSDLPAVMGVERRTYSSSLVSDRTQSADEYYTYTVSM